MALDLPFVKFQRGTQAQYDNLKTKGRLESDALYFIYDQAHPADGGVLYIGQTLIGGTGSMSGATSLSGLNDVDLNGVSLSEGMILQYNENSGKWEAVSSAELRSSVNSGNKTGSETGPQAAARIDATPLEGDIVFVDNVPYIYDGNNWQLLVGEDLSDRVEALETAMQAIDGTIQSTVNTAISNLNHLTYVTVQTLPAIADAASNTVYLVGDSSSQSSDKYEEYLFVNGAFEKIGHFEPNLNDYLTISTFNSTVSDLNTAINGLQSNFDNYLTVSTYNSEIGNISNLRTATGDNSETVVSGLVDLYDRLTWTQLPTDTP